MEPDTDEVIPEVETLAQALSFEYYLGAVTQVNVRHIDKEDAIAFYEENKEEYLDKAEKIIKLITESYVTLH